MSKLRVMILNGMYRNAPVKNVSFELVEDYRIGAKGGYVKVDGTTASRGTYPPKAFKISVADANCYRPDYGQNDPLYEESITAPAAEEQTAEPSLHQQTIFASPEQFKKSAVLEGDVEGETEADAIGRIQEKFTILEEMTLAVAAGTVKGLVISGPAGAGKSFGVEKVLDDCQIFNKAASMKLSYEVVKGSSSAIGLYKKLFEFSSAGSVVVFDDCDSILFDEVSLNLLKAALDSTKNRYLFWNSESRILAQEGIPNKFKFEGAVIFITNLKFESVRSVRIRDHLLAIQSRCHYLDLSLDSQRDVFLRIKSVVNSTDMMKEYEFTNGEGEEILNYIRKNLTRLRELSLRTVLKIADLRKSQPTRWEVICNSTILKKPV